ncbi:MAG: FKBP-type peptidyl-prolyl cis-trans isomerase [Rikenellaceae bacterium]
MAKRPDPKYVAENLKFLEQLKNDPDVIVFDSGVICRIIENGSGTATPKLNSLVSVHYRGTLIDGSEFDSTLGDGFPATFRLREVIEGWQIALQNMHVGDTWKIYIPASLGYGPQSIDGIPGGSTLIFEVSLLSIN